MENARAAATARQLRLDAGCSAPAAGADGGFSRAIPMVRYSRARSHRSHARRSHPGGNRSRIARRTV